MNETAFASDADNNTPYVVSNNIEGVIINTKCIADTFPAVK